MHARYCSTCSDRPTENPSELLGDFFGVRCLHHKASQIVGIHRSESVFLIVGEPTWKVESPFPFTVMEGETVAAVQSKMNVLKDIAFTVLIPKTGIVSCTKGLW